MPRTVIDGPQVASGISIVATPLSSDGDACGTWLWLAAKKENGMTMRVAAMALSRRVDYD